MARHSEGIYVPLLSFLVFSTRGYQIEDETVSIDQQVGDVKEAVGV